MTVTILASIESSSDVIETLVNIYKHAGYRVYYPVKQDRPRIDIDSDFLNYIDNSHFCVAVPKPDGTFGESTTYEMAYCKHINKQLIIY